MKLSDLPFKIGMEYEHWEFDLEPIVLDLKTPYEKYKYIKNDITEISGFKVKAIYLYFKLDILDKVELILKN